MGSQDDYLPYGQLPNVAATWLVDPPYQTGAGCYKVSGLDYAALATWCKERAGQCIVYENGAADGLPFRPLVEFRGQRHVKTETV